MRSAFATDKISVVLPVPAQESTKTFLPLFTCFKMCACSALNSIILFKQLIIFYTIYVVV